MFYKNQPFWKPVFTIYIKEEGDVLKSLQGNNYTRLINVTKKQKGERKLR